MSAQAAPRTARKRRARWAVIALVVVAVIVAVVVGMPALKARNDKKNPAVATTTVGRGDLVVKASADGETEPVESFDVRAEVGGTVSALDVAVGDRVEAGDRLFTVDADDLRKTARSAKAQLRQTDQQLAQARQQLQQAEYQVMVARNRLADLKSLPSTRPVTATQIDEAQKNVTVAQAGLKTAKAGLASAKTSQGNASQSYSDAVDDIDKVVTVAPVDGVVIAVNVAEGGTVSAGGASSGGAVSAATVTGAMSGVSASSSSGDSGSSAPVVIADISELKVTVAVNEVDISDVKVGQEALVSFDAVRGLDVTGSVTWISPNSVTKGSIKTYDVEIALGSQSDRLRPGMTASADIVTARVDDALLVPKTAVRVDGTSTYVTVVKSDGSQEKRVVTTGLSDVPRIEILTNLKDAEKIATDFAAVTKKSGNPFMPPRDAMGGRN